MVSKLQAYDKSREKTRGKKKIEQINEYTDKRIVEDCYDLRRKKITSCSDWWISGQVLNELKTQF